MKLRLVQFSLGPGRRAAAEKIAKRVVPLVREQAGCKRCEFFADYEAGDYGVVVLWATQEAADAAAPVVGPILTRAIAGAKGVGDTRRLYDVYEPRTS